MSGFAANGEELGRQIARWFGNALDQIKWEDVGQAIHDMLSGLLDVIIGFLDEMDWDDVGEKIGEFLEGLDWKSITEKLGEALRLAIIALRNVLSDEFADSAETKAIGADIVLGVMDGMLGKTNPLIASVIDLFQVVITAIRAFLGIHSPSTVFAEIGRYLIEGLLLGIQELWVSLQEWFATTFENLILFFTEKWTLIKEGALEIWNNLKDSLAETWDSIKESVAEKFDAVKEKIEEVWNAVKECIDLKVKDIKGKVKELTDKFTELKKDVSTAFTNIKESIINALSPVIDKLKDFIQWVKDAIQAVKDFSTAVMNRWVPQLGRHPKQPLPEALWRPALPVSALLWQIYHIWLQEPSCGAGTRSWP